MVTIYPIGLNINKILLTSHPKGVNIANVKSLAFKNFTNCCLLEKTQKTFSKEATIMDHFTYEVRLAQWAQIVKAGNERPKGELLKDWLDSNDISETLLKVLLKGALHA